MSVESKKRLAATLAGIFGLSGAALLAVSLPFIFPAFRKIVLPFVPASETQIINLVSILKGKQGTLVDLGSGNGSIVFAAAELGLKSTGVELNPWLILYSKVKAQFIDKNHLTTFKRQDLWKTDLKAFNHIVIFGVDEMMPILEDKVKHLNNTTIIACRFPFVHLKPDQIIGTGIDTVWVYKL